LRYVRSLHPEHRRLAIIVDNFSPHLTTKTDRRVGDYAAAHNIELVYVPFNARWLNRPIVRADRSAPDARWPT